jgi:hypothetical protein
MRRPPTLPARGPLAAAVALAASVALSAAALWSAVRLDPLPTAAPLAPPPLLTADTAGGARHRVAAGDSGATGGDALDNDPFDPDRQLPEAYAAADPAPEIAGPPPVPVAVVRLLGTVVLPGGRSFAVYQLPSQAPQTLRVGERIGTLTLVAVEPGRAIFRDADGRRVELHLPKAGA